MRIWSVGFRGFGDKGLGFRGLGFRGFRVWGPRAEGLRQGLGGCRGCGGGGGGGVEPLQVRYGVSGLGLRWVYGVWGFRGLGFRIFGLRV